MKQSFNLSIDIVLIITGVKVFIIQIILLIKNQIMFKPN